jgi:hypothetical protein
MNDLELRKRLNVMKARAAYITGQIGLRTPENPGKPLGPEVVRFFTEALTVFDDPEKYKAGQALLAKANNREDMEARTRLNSIRIVQATNYILASQNIIPFFFDITVLAENERPAFINSTIQEVRVRYVSQDGSPPELKVIKPQAEVLIDLRLLSTPIITYMKMDIYKGNVVDSALQTLRLAYDMANQQEQLAKDLLLTGLGSFLTTGPPHLRSYFPNSRIKTALLPTTNDITVPNSSSSGALSKFRFAVFKEAEKYSTQWGAFGEKGPLNPTGRILVPGGEASDLADEIVPSGSTSNPVADALLEDGWMVIDYLGRKWIVVSDNTLAPGACYVELGRKPAHAFLKPSMDREEVKDDYETRLRNEEERYMQKVFGAYINETERMNFCRIRYNTSYDPNNP